MTDGVDTILKTISGERTLHPETIDEALFRWDAGESLFSIELGGLGPGYEQAIQVTGMELIREFKDKCDIKWDDDDEAAKICDAVFNFSLKNEIIKNMCLSGAQFGAARNMAFVFIRHGWEKGLDMAHKDRHIQISKNFPVID
jgi:hypothetical protein